MWRFTRTGVINGVTVIDDYGHHYGGDFSGTGLLHSTRRNVIAVVQPHRYTRLRDLFGEFCTCFNDADTVIVTDIYAAGEPLDGYDRDALIKGLLSRGHRDVLALETAEALPGLIAELAEPEDFVVCLGAGNIDLGQRPTGCIIGTMERRKHRRFVRESA